MHMGKTPKNQSLTKPLLLLFIVPSLYYACFSLGIFGFSTLFVLFPIMILSARFLPKFTKKKPNKPLLSSQRNRIEINEVIEELETHAKQCNKEDKIEPMSEESETARQSGNAIQQESEVLELEDFPSESEVSEQSSDEDNLELKLWNLSSSTNVGQKLPIYGPYFSEDEDEDDDNLIEINLPGSESSSFGEDRKGLMELLAEMNNEINEEDNLIEIDISMGSTIKCPRFEIKA